MRDFTAQTLLNSPAIQLWDVCCSGSRREESAEEAVAATQLVFPYRGVYVRRVGPDEAVAEANQVLFFNAEETYRVSHPVCGGDASLALVICDGILSELASPPLLQRGTGLRFRRQRLRIDARAQAL